MYSERTRVLNETKKLLDNEHNWCKGNFTEILDDDGCAHCLYGAIIKAIPYEPSCDYWNRSEDVVDFVRAIVLDQTANNTLISFNDHPDTTHNDVIQVLNAAIEKSIAEDSKEPYVEPT